MLERRTITGPHGRLEVQSTGPESGRAIVYHAGTPGAGMQFSPLVDVGAERGLRHVCYSRPGYGDSDRHAGRSVADCAADVAAIADALGIERFFAAGASGGGPHALACAALLPDRVIAVATIASVAPAQADGLDWYDGMGRENLDEFAAAEAGGAELRPLLERERAQMIEASGPELHAAFGELLDEVDRRALTGAFADYLAECIRAGLEHGVDGWVDDDLAFVRDWGFALGDISRPVIVWQGGHDRMVPAAHGQWLAAHVPRAQARLLPDEGHLSLMLGSYGRILDELIAAGD